MSGLMDELIDREAEFARRFPNKRVIVRDPEWSYGELTRYYMRDPARGERAAIKIAAQLVKPNIAILEPTDLSVYLETNADGLFGPEVKRDKKLVVIWGDSVVQGWRRGWVEALSDRIPGFQILNGGVSGISMPQIALRAVALNRILPICVNLFLPGWNTLGIPIPASQTVYATLLRLLRELPNVILCTQPTSLNADVVKSDIAPWLTTARTIGYRGGYHFWGDTPPTVANVTAMYAALVAQNEAVHRVVRDCRSLYGKQIPLIDLYERFSTQGRTDFRDQFVDPAHFRVEAYPCLQAVFYDELRSLLLSQKELGTTL